MSSRFLSVPYFLCQITIFLLQYLSSVFFFIRSCFFFFSASNRVRASVGCLRPQGVCSACCAIKKGRWMCGRSGNEIFLCRCARNCYIVWFIAPIPDPNPIPSPYPCPARDWVDKFHRSNNSSVNSHIFLSVYVDEKKLWYNIHDNIILWRQWN